MEQKTKFILIGLIGISAVCFFLYIQAFSSKQLVLRERDELKKENMSLGAKIGKLEDGLRDYENKIGLLNSELDSVRIQKQEAEKKYELANKEKEELAAALKARPKQMIEVPVSPAPAAQAQDFAQTADAYWAQVLKAKTALEVQLADLRNELKSTQINNEQLQREKSALELDTRNLLREKEDFKRQIEYSQKLMDSISQELVRERNDKIKIQETFEKLKNENRVLVRQLKSLDSRKIDLERRLQKFKEEKAALENRMNIAEAMLADKTSQLKSLKNQLGVPVADTEEAAAAAFPQINDLGASRQAAPDVAGGSDRAEPLSPSSRRESVELPPIVVRPQSASTLQANAAAAVEAKILAVNRDGNFVVVDAGENSGLKAGDSLRVYRENKIIAYLEAIQVRSDIAACDIKKEIAPVKTGDAVR